MRFIMIKYLFFIIYNLSMRDLSNQQKKIKTTG